MNSTVAPTHPAPSYAVDSLHLMGLIAWSPTWDFVTVTHLKFARGIAESLESNDFRLNEVVKLGQNLYKFTYRHRSRRKVTILFVSQPGDPPGCELVYHHDDTGEWERSIYRISVWPRYSTKARLALHAAQMEYDQTDWMLRPTLFVE